jgi:hypothetical protein
VKRTNLAIAIAGAGFMGLLLYLSILTAPPAPPTGVAHSAGAAGEACVREVRTRHPEARFPFSPNVEYLGDARYRLTGTVEFPDRGEIVRRNYDCTISYVADRGSYRPDSVAIWQSH